MTETKTKDVAVRPPTRLAGKGIDLQTPEEMKAFAVTARVSGFADHLRPRPNWLQKKDPEFMATLDARHNAAIFMAVQAGLEHGMLPFGSLASSYVVGGKHAFWGKAIPALLWKSGKVAAWDEEWEGSLETHDLTCVLTMERSDNHVKRTARYGIQDARQHKVDVWDGDGEDRRKRRISLWDKDNYQNTPKKMLRWRAIHEIADLLFSDVMVGIDIAEIAQDDRPMETPEYREVETGWVSGEDGSIPKIEGPVATLPGMESEPDEPGQESVNDGVNDHVIDAEESPLDGSGEAPPPVVEADEDVRSKGVIEEFRKRLGAAKLCEDAQMALNFLESHAAAFSSGEYQSLYAEGEDVISSLQP